MPKKKDDTEIFVLNDFDDLDDLDTTDMAEDLLLEEEVEEKEDRVLMEGIEESMNPYEEEEDWDEMFEAFARSVLEGKTEEICEQEIMLSLAHERGLTCKCPPLNEEELKLLPPEQLEFLRSEAIALLKGEKRIEDLEKELQGLIEDEWLNGLKWSVKKARDEGITEDLISQAILQLAMLYFITIERPVKYRKDVFYLSQPEKFNELYREASKEIKRLKRKFKEKLLPLDAVEV